jgi:hypothetical protein
MVCRLCRMHGTEIGRTAGERSVRVRGSECRMVDVGYMHCLGDVAAIMTEFRDVQKSEVYYEMIVSCVVSF